jgi:O-antigen/teichoic acid export membrane protein
MADETDGGILTLATQGSITFIGNILGKALSFIFIAVATRLVSPSEYGIFTLGLSIVLFVQGFASLNIYRSVDFFVPQFLSDSEYGKAKKTLQNAFVIGVGTSVIGAIILFFAKDQLAALFNEPAIAAVLPLFLLLIPLQTVFRLLMVSFNSIKKMKYRVAVKNVFNPLVRTLGAIVLVSVGAGVMGLIGGYLIGITLAILSGFAFLFYEADWLRGTKTAPISTRSLVSYSLPLMFAGVIYSVVGQIDYFVIGYFLGSASVGQYRVAYLLSANILIVLSAMTPIFKPTASELRYDTARLERHYQLATQWVTMFTLPIAITLILAPEVYLSIVFTEQYAVAGAAVVALTFGYLINALFGPEGMILEGLGKTRLTLFNTTVLIGVNGVLDVFLVPQFGILGAAVATGTALTVAGFLGVLEIYTLRSIIPFNSNLVRILLAAIPAAVCGLFLVSLSLKDVYIFPLLPTLIVVIYLVSLRLVGGFTQAERDIAAQIDTRLGMTLMTRLVPSDD